MGIIEFILNNWFILVIIYIVISTFTKNKKGRAEQPDKPNRPARPAPGGMPSFGGDGPGLPKRTKERQGPMAAPPAENRAIVPQEIRQEPAPAQAPRPERMQRSRSTPQTQASGLRRPSVRQQSPVTASFRPTPEDLARGVLWAEILGPPRAKRPYRR
ncbi:hypothetical protein [Paenibacillus sp. PvR052]